MYYSFFLIWCQLSKKTLYFSSKLTFELGSSGNMGKQCDKKYPIFEVLQGNNSNNK